MRLANLWSNGRLAAAVGSDLSCEVYRRTLYQPYWVHVQRNSAAVITGTTTKVFRTVQALTALLQLVTSAVVAGGLLLGLLLIDSSVAMGAAALFGGVYSLLAVTSRKKLQRNSQRITSAANQQIKALQEGLGQIRDVLLDGNQGTYVNIYRESDRTQRQLQADNLFLGIFPRYALEALGTVALTLLGGLLVLQGGAGKSIIPLLGGLALGAQRLLPALQQVYGNWSMLKGCTSDLAGVLEMLNQPMPPLAFVSEPFNCRRVYVWKNYASDTDRGNRRCEGAQFEIPW